MSSSLKNLPKSHTQKIVIGLTGEKGGGKETVGNLIIGLLPQKRVVRVRSSDILAETLSLWNLPITRHNLQYQAIIMDAEFGKGTLSRAVQNRIESTDADVVIFDGIRWDTDVKLLKSFSKNTLVYVTADMQTRYERIKSRKEKAGEGTHPYKQFLAEEKVPTETNIRKLSKKADFTILNNADLPELRAEVRRLLVDIKGLGL